MENKIEISCLIDHDKEIVKKLSWDGKKLQKEAKASINIGVCENILFDWEEFKDYLTTLPNDECLVLGNLIHSSSGIIVSSKEQEDISKQIFRRTKDNFQWHKNCQLCCIDFDGSKAGNIEPKELIAEIDKVLQGFADITKVVKYSSSAWIYGKNNELLSSTNGFHIYFMVNHPELITEIFKGGNGSRAWLHKKLWIAGHGYIKNSRPSNKKTSVVSQMERTIYDSTVFSPERIIFEAEPILENGLYKENQEAFIIEGDNEHLDLTVFEPLTEAEEKEYLLAVRNAKIENKQTPYMIESRKIFEDHVREKIKTGIYIERPEYNGLEAEEIVKREFKASENVTLMQDHAIELASGEHATVKDLLNEPDKYHNQKCKDPHEPDYGSSTVASIYTSQKVPVIYSHAHGGITYRLETISQKSKNTETDKPNYYSKDYWLKHFYFVGYDKKNEIYHINGNKIEPYSCPGFHNRFSGFYTTVGEEKIAISRWWLSNVNKLCITGDGFAPGKPIIYEKYGELVINDYVPEILHYGFKTPSKKEYTYSALPWFIHIEQMIHNKKEAETLIDWFAFLVQHPAERPMWSPLIISETRGVGKDMTTDIFTGMMGHKYARKSTIETLSKGDGWGNVFHHTKLITVSECGSNKDRYTIENTIKDSITTKAMQMNIKGKDIVFGDVYAGIIFFSNFTSPFRLEEGDRRFFVTRCDWSKKIADEYKRNGHFAKLTSFYSNPVHLYGLYHYLLNREIETDIKSDAPLTPTKEIMMCSEPNETEQFFIDLRKHPCRYWTTSMINELCVKTFGPVTDLGNKQYKHLMGEMMNIKKIKIQGKTHRLKTFNMNDAELDSNAIRTNIEDNWNITTLSLEPISQSETLNIADMCCGGETDNGKGNSRDNILKFPVSNVAEDSSKVDDLSKICCGRDFNFRDRFSNVNF